MQCAKFLTLECVIMNAWSLSAWTLRVFSVQSGREQLHVSMVCIFMLYCKKLWRRYKNMFITISFRPRNYMILTLKLLKDKQRCVTPNFASYILLKLLQSTQEIKKCRNATELSKYLACLNLPNNLPKIQYLKNLGTIKCVNHSMHFVNKTTYFKKPLYFSW